MFCFPAGSFYTAWSGKPTLAGGSLAGNNRLTGVILDFDYFAHLKPSVHISTGRRISSGIASSATRAVAQEKGDKEKEDRGHDGGVEQA